MNTRRDGAAGPRQPLRAHDQHDAARRGADGDRRSAGEGAHRLQLESRLRSRPIARTCCADCARDDLFTVVLEHFQTDTADYADVLLPATTQLEHDDLHKAYGHLYATYNRRSIEPLGEALPNSEIFRRIAAAMKLDHPELRESDEELMRAALTGTGEVMNGVTFEALREHGSVRLNVPSPHLPFRSGTKVPTPSGKHRDRIGADRGARARSAADVRRAVRVGRARAGAGAALSAGADLAAGARVPQLVVRQRGLAAPLRGQADAGDSRRRRARAVDRRRRARENLQRPRHLHRRRRRHRPRPPRRRLRAVGVVGPLDRRTARTRIRRRRRRSPTSDAARRFTTTWWK